MTKLVHVDDDHLDERHMNRLRQSAHRYHTHPAHRVLGGLHRSPIAVQLEVISLSLLQAIINKST